MRNETERSGNSRVEGGEMPPPRAIISLSRVTNARGLQMQTAKMDDRESRDPSGGGDGPPTCVFQHFPPDLPLHFFLPFHSRAGILNGCRARSAPLGSARLGSALRVPFRGRFFPAPRSGGRVEVPPARRISRFASEIRGRRGGEFREAPAGLWRPTHRVGMFRSLISGAQRSASGSRARTGTESRGGQRGSGEPGPVFPEAPLSCHAICCSYVMIVASLIPGACFVTDNAPRCLCSRAFSPACPARGVSSFRGGGSIV